MIYSDNKNVENKQYVAKFYLNLNKHSSTYLQSTGEVPQCIH